MHTVLTGTAETSRLSPRNGLRLIRDLPGERPFLPPLPAGKSPANVAPGSRRQDHTTSPSAAGVFVGVTCVALTPQRPSPPAPTCRDDRETSLMRRGMNGL